MVMVPKNMDEFLKIAKDASVKVADTISKLCSSYVAKAGAETSKTEAEKPAAAEARPGAANAAQEEPPKTN